LTSAEIYFLIEQSKLVNTIKSKKEGIDDKS